MNVKLKRVIEEIGKTEKKISEWQEQLKQLKQQRKQLEDQEIIKAIRSMQMEGMDMLHLLDGIQDGSVIFVSDDDGNVHMEQEENRQQDAAEREDMTNEK
jgi:predicted RNase H-like nuclease (RuvC/YqgF family)